MEFLIDYREKESEAHDKAMNKNPRATAASKRNKKLSKQNPTRMKNIPKK